MDRIDRYVLRQFILTFAFGLLAFVVIYVAVDLMEHLGDFLDHDASTSIIFQYYVYQVPDIVHLIAPISMLLGSLFTIGRLDQNNELTAIRSAGRSMRRIALPLFVFAIGVSFGMMYFDGWVVPVTNRLHFDIGRKYLGTSQVSAQRNVYMRISPSVNLLLDYFDPSRGEANLVSIERFDTMARVPFAALKRTSPTAFSFTEDTATAIKITERIDAATMTYDTTKKFWTMHNGVTRNFHDDNNIVTTTFQAREINFLPVTPTELNLSQQNVSELTVEEFWERIEQERLSGRDVNRSLVDYYAKFSFPFASLIVVFFGIPFSSRQRKSGAAVQIAITAFVSAIYLVLSEISKTFSYGDAIPPVAIAWMVNVLFTVVGVFNLLRIERG